MDADQLRHYAIVYAPGCIDSTPYSHSTASMTQFDDILRPVHELDRYLLEDLKYTKLVSNEEFLIGLGVSENVATQKEKDNTVEEVLADADVSQLFKEYARPVTKETQRYGSFCELVNRCLDLLLLKGLRFSRVDPKGVRGFRGSWRKPDVAAISSEHPFVANDRWRACSAGPPKDGISLSWKAIKLLWEFKLNQERLQPMVKLDHLESMLTAPAVIMPLADLQAVRLEARDSSNATSETTARSKSGLKRMQEEANFDSTGQPKKRKIQGYEWQKTATLELRVGGVRYAADTLTDCPNRRHCIEGLVMDSVVFMAYYDRAGPVLAKGFDFGVKKSRYVFILLLKALAQLDDAGLGFMPCMDYISDADDDAVPTLPTRDDVTSDRDVTPASAGCAYPPVPHTAATGGESLHSHAPTRALPISQERAHGSGGGAENTDDERELQSTPTASLRTPTKPKDVDDRTLSHRIFGGSSPLTPPPSLQVPGDGDTAETLNAMRAEDVFGTVEPVDDVFGGPSPLTSLPNPEFGDKFDQTDSTDGSEGSSDDDLRGLALIEKSSEGRPDNKAILEQTTLARETEPSHKPADDVSLDTCDEVASRRALDDEFRGLASTQKSSDGKPDKKDVSEQMEESNETEPLSDSRSVHVPPAVGSKVISGSVKPKLKLVIKHYEFFLFHVLDKRLAYGVVTRGGRVYLALAPKFDRVNPNRLYVVKTSWPYSRRLHEGKIIEMGKAALAKRETDPEFKKKYGNRKLSNSLAQVFLYDELDRLAGRDTFRWRIFGENFDLDRSLRFLVLEYLRPLYTLENLDHFKQAVRDMVLAHHFLAISNELILHRDISPDNLMVRQEGDNVRGVLNDLDLAMVGDPTADRHHGARTGTRPFMACDLFNGEEVPPLHLERFDWESFFYVIYWIGCRYSAGKLISKTALKEWYVTDPEILVPVKEAALHGSSKESFRKFQDFFRPLEDAWIEPLQTMFYDGHRRKKAFFKRRAAGAPFDFVTNGGQITWERFWTILQD